MEQVIEFLYSDLWNDIWDKKLLQCAFIIVGFIILFGCLAMAWLNVQMEKMEERLKEQLEKKLKQSQDATLEQLQKIQQQELELQLQLSGKEKQF